MPVFLIETESRFKMKYAIEAETFDEAFRLIRNGAEDFYQEHSGELLRDVQVVTDEELLYQIRKDNNYYSSWTDEKILEVFKNAN